MKLFGHPHNLNKGFTLLEVIVVLIMISLFGIIFVSFFDTQIVGSTKPVTMMQQGFALEDVLEKINADYENLVTSDATPLVTLETKINASPSVYGEYTATTKFITFDGSDNEESAACTVNCTTLKVIITIGDQTLTTLFTK
ncbi:MAG: type II secretion system GspH family protein [Desulfobacula sp.]|nr:type II secretion system GspH family protein [Desulfobacula sp.]